MAYDITKATTLGQVKLSTAYLKAYIDNAIDSLPEDTFLDQAKTKFVESFAFSAAEYPGATDPSLEGAPVLVLAVKGDKGAITYSFVDLRKLVDTYTAEDMSIDVTNAKIKVNLSAVEHNALELKEDGLYVYIPSDEAKMDKVDTATEGNIAIFDANGNVADGAISAADLVTKADVCTDNEVREMLREVLGEFYDRLQAEQG